MRSPNFERNYSSQQVAIIGVVHGDIPYFKFMYRKNWNIFRFTVRNKFTLCYLLMTIVFLFYLLMIDSFGKLGRWRRADA